MLGEEGIGENENGIGGKMGDGDRDWKFQEVILVRRERQAQKKQSKEKFRKTQKRDMREDRGKTVRERHKEGSGILGGKKGKGEEGNRERSGETGKVWENRGEGKEVGNVTGASGWQGWMVGRWGEGQ